MKKLYLHKSPTAQWHQIIFDAEHSTRIILSEDVEHYLVSLLLRYTNKPEFVNNILGKLYLEAQDESTEKMAINLRDIGDQCLLFSGLFPEHAKRRRVPVSYFERLGKMSYLQLSALHTHIMNTVYSALSEEFDGMTEILYSIRSLDAVSSNINLKFSASWSNMARIKRSH